MSTELYRSTTDRSKTCEATPELLRALLSGDVGEHALRP